MKNNLYYYGLGALALLMGSGAVAYAALSDGPKVTQSATATSDALSPVKPDIQATFNADASTGKAYVKVDITAPSSARDDKYNEYPIEAVNRVELYRYAESADNTLLKTWNNVAAGEKLTFDDEESLEPREEYTYIAKTYLNGVSGSDGYAYLVYGINPIAPDTPKIESNEGQAPVTISYVCPDAKAGEYWDSTPFPEGVEYTEIRLFKLDNEGEEIVLRSDNDPVPGQSFEYVDNDAHDGFNNYYLRTYTAFGYSANAYARIYLGEDYPGRVSNVKAVATDDGITVTWDAPTVGGNGGHIDLSKTRYKLYRIDNDYFQNPVMLADDLAECRYVDDLSGVEGETMLYYRVYPYNEVEMPSDAVYNYGETPNGILAGPPAALPFKESFNAGSKFNKLFDNKWEEEFDNYAFDSHFIKNDVTVDNDGEPRDVTEGVDGPGTPEIGADAFYFVKSGMWTSSTAPGYLTTGNLSFADAVNPYLSFYYIPVAGSKGMLRVQMPTGETDENGGSIFADILMQDYSLLTDGSPVAPEANLEWQKIMIPLTEFAGKRSSKVRFAFNYEDPSEGRYPMLLDQVVVEDYPGAIDLAIEQKEETLLLTWNLPESAAGKQPLYTIILNGEKIAETTDNEYTYEGAEQGESYAFEVATTYPDEGIEAPTAKAEALDIPLVNFTLDGFLYNVSEEATLSLQGYEGSELEIVIPASVEYKGNTYPVTHIIPKLFNAHRKIKSVDIRAEVSEIPENCFYGCVALENVTLPSTVTIINNYAFFGCSSMKQIELPNALTTIGNNAFENCLTLESISFGENLTEIGDRAFSRCQALAKVTFASEVPPTVGVDAFSGINADCVGECPYESTDAYLAVENLSPIHFPNTGIESINADNIASVEYFSTAGVRLEKPLRGLPMIVRITCTDGSVKTFKQVL